MKIKKGSLIFQKTPFLFSIVSYLKSRLEPDEILKNKRDRISSALLLFFVYEPTRNLPINLPLNSPRRESIMSIIGLVCIEFTRKETSVPLLSVIFKPAAGSSVTV